MDEYISVKEFAKITSLSRQTVYLKLDKDLRDFVKIVDGKRKINVKALELFDIKFDTSSSNDFTKFTDKEQNNGTSTKNIIEILTHQIDILTCQIDIKDKQLAEKDRQIKDLTNALLNEQNSAQQAHALHAGTIKHIETRDNTLKPFFFTKWFKKNYHE